MSVTAGQLSDLLARPMEGVARVVIAHVAQRSFRWLFVLEVILFGLGCLILLPCVALAMVGGSDLGHFDLPSFKGRSHHYWQELFVRVLGPEGHLLAEVGGRPADAAEAHGWVATALEAARRQGVVVVETIHPVGGGVETRCVWYGGQPLFTSPEMRAEHAAAEVLGLAGFVVESHPDAVIVSHPVAQTPRFVAILVLILFGCPMVVMLITEGGRRALGDLWAAASGRASARRVYTIRAESFDVRWVRDGEVREAELFDGASLLGVTHAPSLSWEERMVRRVPPRLTIVSRDGTRTLPMSDEKAGPALRDLITASTIRLRAMRPELGLMGDGPRPTRCPYCSQLYTLVAGGLCPSCGAPAQLS